MADVSYLIALALVDLAGRRALPLNGKSFAAATDPLADPGEAGHALALELLLRLWQRSDDGHLQRAAGDASLLLIEVPLEALSEICHVSKPTGLPAEQRPNCSQHSAPSP